MATFGATTLATLQRQLGHVTSSQLEAGGIGRTARRKLVDDRVLDHPFKSVYRVANRRPTFEQRLIALSLAHPRGFITGPTAGGYLGLRRMPRASLVHFCIPHDARIDIPAGVLMRQSTKVGSLDVRVLDNGMRVASWSRLLFDLAADLKPLNLASVIDQVLQLGYCSVDELGGVARRLCHPSRRGSESFMSAMFQRGDRQPVESHPEILVLHGLLARGVPVEPQHRPLQLPNGTKIRIDLAVPAARWAVEVDVHPRHNRPEGVASDKRRIRQLHRIDWQIESVTDEDLLNPEALFDELATNYRKRVAVVAA